MLTIALVAAGGAAGSVLRYLCILAAGSYFGPQFPIGTVFVNVAGSFLIGLFVELIARHGAAPDMLRLLLVTGFLGGFTTFSTFSLDFAVLWERGQLWLACLYLIASTVVGILALFAGLWAGRTWA